MSIELICCKFDRTLTKKLLKLDEWMHRLADSILDLFCYALAAYYDTPQGFYDYLPTKKMGSAVRAQKDRLLACDEHVIVTKV